MDVKTVIFFIVPLSERLEVLFLLGPNQLIHHFDIFLAGFDVAMGRVYCLLFWNSLFDRRVKNCFVGIAVQVDLDILFWAFRLFIIELLLQLFHVVVEFLLTAYELNTGFHVFRGLRVLTSLNGNLAWNFRLFFFRSRYSYLFISCGQVWKFFRLRLYKLRQSLVYDFQITVFMSCFLILCRRDVLYFEWTWG